MYLFQRGTKHMKGKIRKSISAIVNGRKYTFKIKVGEVFDMAKLPYLVEQRDCDRILRRIKAEIKDGNR